jgi:hypothetical protein
MSDTYTPPNRPGLTLSAVDSPVRTSATPASEQGSTANGPACGLNLHDSFASWNHDTSSWKTSQLCLDGDYQEFLETWPRAGMTRSGIAFQRPPLAPLIGEIASGSWPTPTADDADNVTRASGSFQSLTRVVMMPTPCATDADKGGRGELYGFVNGTKGYRGGWPTPDAHRRGPMTDPDATGARIWSQTAADFGECRRQLGRAWAVEPDVGRVAYGVPARVDRLRGLGNALVPQIAQWLGERIKEAEGVTVA